MTGVYGYLRVSTELQDNGVDAQKTVISRAEDIDEWFEERASGKNMTDRPVFNDLLDRVCAEQGTLVVSKLDRLGRSVVDVLNVFERVKQCGASIKVLDMGIDTSTATGEMMLTILAAFAQFERRMISQRTKEGLAAARASGVVLGRPVSVEAEAIKAAVDDGWTDSMMAEAFKVSPRTVKRLRKRHGY